MTKLVLVTFDWVPETPRGYVRDLRVRWALEEAGLAYRVETTPFRDRGAAHIARQPFGQAPWLIDGPQSIFETGAILLHLGEKNMALLPRDPQARSTTIQWLFAALNSVEMAVLPWTIGRFSGAEDQTPLSQALERFLQGRLQHMDAVLAHRDWAAGDTFTVADIAMADVLRLADRFDGLAHHPRCRDYVRRATARPAFITAHADQLAHFAAAD